MLQSTSWDNINIANIILLVIIFILSTYLGIKLFNFLKSIIIDIYKYNKRFKYTSYSLQSSCGSGPLLVLLGGSVSASFHARQEYKSRTEINSLNTVILKLDREQPHPSGCSRISAFGEYIQECYAGKKALLKWILS